MKQLLDNTKLTVKIAVPALCKISFIDVSCIVRCQSEDCYTHIFLENGNTLLSTKPLKDYEILLSGSGFYRIHRSHLINLRKVAEYRKNETDSVVLEDGTNLQLSRKKRTEFLKVMSDSFLLRENED